jgi:hypothetical protein
VKAGAVHSTPHTSSESIEPGMYCTQK